MNVGLVHYWSTGTGTGSIAKSIVFSTWTNRERSHRLDVTQLATLSHAHSQHWIALVYFC